MTYGDMMNMVTGARTREEAKKVFDSLVDDLVTRHKKTKQEARAITKSNIGYCSGYYDEKTASRVLNLFDTEHPIFGKYYPSPKEAFEKGLEKSK